MFGNNNKLLYTVTEENEKLRCENARLKTELAKSDEKLAILRDNVGYLVEKGVLNGTLHGSLIEAMALNISLRKYNFIATKEEIDKYFTE